jgi:hypothetical protein
LWAGAAVAADTDAKLDIYPKDCVFEQVNNGTNQVTFLTPAECGQQVTITEPEPDTQTLAPISLANPTEEPPVTEVPPVLAEEPIQIFLAQIAPAITIALTSIAPWIVVSAASGGGLLVSFAIDPKTLAPMAMFRFVLSYFFKR